MKGKIADLSKKVIFRYWFITIEKWLNSNVLNIDFKLFCIRFFKGGVTSFGRITKHKFWELDIFKGGDELCLNSTIHRIDVHSVYSFNFQLPWLFDFQFEIYDNREKETPKIRRKIYCFLKNTQHLKIYNLDALNKLWNITFDLALFPLLYYIKFSYGPDKYNWALFNFQIKKDDNNALTAKLKLCLFCIFIEFEIGENTVIRDANTYYYEDFRTLEVFGADVLKHGKYGCNNIINIQIAKKNLAFLYALLEWHFNFQSSDYGLNTDEILLLAADKDFYNKKIFELVTKHINYIKNWDENIEQYKEDIEPYAYWVLCQLKDNSVPPKKVPTVEKKDIKEKVFSWLKKHFRANFDKYNIGYDFDIRIKGNGFSSFRFNCRKLDKGEYESNFQLSLTRDFWIRNYLLTGFTRFKDFSIQISHNNVWLLTVETKILGVWQIFNIGARTEDCFYNFKEKRQMTYEEHIMQDNLKKEVNTDEPDKRRKKYKEFYWSKGLKVYNNNYLHNPYGRTVEFSLPFNKYLKFSFNHHLYYEYKNETNIEFRIDAADDSVWFGKKSYMRLKISAFKHYFKIVLGSNTIARPSVIHSNKSLAKFKGATVDKETLNNLFKNKIKPYEAWVYKKVANLEIDLTELDFNDLIYELGRKIYYNKATFDYILELAKSCNARFYLDDDYKNSTNIEIIKALKEKYASDFDEPALNQLADYIKEQKDIEMNKNTKNIIYFTSREPKDFDFLFDKLKELTPKEVDDVKQKLDITYWTEDTFYYEINGNNVCSSTFEDNYVNIINLFEHLAYYDDKDFFLDFNDEGWYGALIISHLHENKIRVTLFDKNVFDETKLETDIVVDKKKYIESFRDALVNTHNEGFKMQTESALHPNDRKHAVIGCEIYKRGIDNLSEYLLYPDKYKSKPKIEEDIDYHYKIIQIKMSETDTNKS